MKNAQLPGIPFCPACGGTGYYRQTKVMWPFKKARKRCWCARFSTEPPRKLMSWMDEKGDGPGTLTYAVKRLQTGQRLRVNDVERIKWYFGQWMNVAEPPKTQAMWWQTMLAEANDNDGLLLFYRVAIDAGVDPL